MAEYDQTTALREKEQKKRKWLLLLLLLLLAIACVTGSIVGYILGRQAAVPTGGQLVDVIPLTPSGGSDIPGIVTVVSEDGTWTQDAYVDLFKGIDTLAPGMEGRYSFQLSNACQEQVRASLTFADTHATPVPFTYWLTDDRENPVEPDEILLDSGSSARYYLYWHWPYESGDDAYDTQLGSSADRAHTVTISIFVETVE